MDSKEHTMSIADQIRKRLDLLEDTYARAMDEGHYGLAMMIKQMREDDFRNLVAAIQAEDPYTTEADIRYFEGVD
jgi:L-amino acid N-acyltransferase YncA